jgi:hypothetical protein
VWKTVNRRMLISGVRSAVTYNTLLELSLAASSSPTLPGFSQYFFGSQTHFERALSRIRLVDTETKLSKAYLLYILRSLTTST